VLVRAPDGYDLALVSTDLGATPAALVERYADRWPVEVLFEEARQVAGVGQARNRTRKAVERTVPFGLVCVSLVVCWYALHRQPAADVATRRAMAPWYQTKHTVSFADMLVAPRRVILAAQYLPGSLAGPPQRKSWRRSVPGPLLQHEPRKSSFNARVERGSRENAHQNPAGSRA
jgi:hypothetical protein